MGIFNRFIDSIRSNDDDDDRYLDDDYFDEEEEDDDFRGKRNQSSSKGVAGFFKRGEVIDGAPQGMQLITIKPTGINDSKVICDSLLEGRIVVLNMEGISTDIAQRIIDFTLGAIYAIEGNLQMISKYIFVASPQSVELSGDYLGDFSGTGTTAQIPKQQSTGSTGNGFTFNV